MLVLYFAWALLVGPEPAQLSAPPLRWEPVRVRVPYRVVPAEPEPRWTPTPAGRAVSLARVYLHEASGRRADERLIATVLRRVGGGRITLRAIRAYSGRAAGVEPPGTARTRWVAQLGPRGRVPPAWAGRRAYWREHVRPVWRRVLRRARRDLRRAPASPCELPAHHWGGPMDDWRARRAGWVRARCSGTLNRGWCAPELGGCGDGGSASNSRV